MDRFLDELKDRTDLLALVGKYAEVKRSGKNYTCRSPFRNERTPSFSIDPDKGVWYDFGASEGGDAIRFIEKIENMNFMEAVEHLADMAGLQVPKSTQKKDKKEEDKEERGYNLHEEATKYFFQQLMESEKAQKYLHKRGIDDETIKNWRIGYGGSQKDGLARHLVAKGYKTHEIAAYGLALESNYGDRGLKDRFVGRILNPINEPRAGRVVGFSGRVLDEKVAMKPEAKYVNSPEHALYKKSKMLFGLHIARQNARKADQIVIAEGNYDVISAHKAGIATCVATCGTSLTEDHLRIIKRMTKNVVLAFDNDKAGKKATLRATEMLLGFGLNPQIINISEEGDEKAIKDLDDMAQRHPEVLKEKIKKAEGALEFFEQAFGKKLLDGSLNGQQKYLSAFFRFLSLSTSPLEVEELLQRAAKRIQKPTDVVKKEFESYKTKKPGGYKEKFVPETVREAFSKDMRMLGFMSSHWSDVKEVAEGALGIFTDVEAKNLLKKMLAGTLTGDEKVRLAATEMLQPGQVEHPSAEVQKWIAKEEKKREKRKKISDMVEKVWES